MSKARKTNILKPKYENMIHLLRARAEENGGDLAYNFLEDGEDKENRISFAELDRRSRAIGAYLQARGENSGHGIRVLLIFHSSIEYIYSFFGCLFAGAVAVTAYPPRVHKNVHDRNLQRLIPISKDSGATFALTTSEILSRIAPLFPELPELAALNWVAVDDVPSALSDDWREPKVERDEVAFLQYTSGSTGVPKGVMVTHYNLLHNQEVMEAGWPTGPDHVYAGWLPIFHDLGLIGLVIRSMYVGAPYHFMQPPSFIQKPVRWLKAISRYGATLSMAPNFAYELCLEKVSESDRATLDLSSWEMALNGAEPVREHTIRRFAEVFRECGFRATTMNPHYGLAEATLVVTGHRTTPPRVEEYDIESLESGFGKLALPGASDETKRLQVSSGEVLGDQRVAIVDPETLTECPEGKIGELWLNGGSVARGYWQRPKETAETFEARISDTGEGPFLRTGDLAFVRDGYVFISSRLKDLIIIRGANHYPQDIEQTCESADPALRPANSAAFAVEIEGDERLVVVQEVERTKRKGDFGDVFRAIRQAIAEKHDVSVYAIALISPGSIPKTTSGKIQRRATKNAFLDGSLNLIAEWRENQPTSEGATLSVTTSVELTPVSSAASEQPVESGRQRIENWLVEYLSRKLGLSPDRIDRRRPLSSYGLNSALSVGLSGDIGEWLNRSVSATLVYEYPTIEAISLFLHSESDFQTGDKTQIQGGGSSFALKRELNAEPVAIVGLACRFPGANNASEYWNLLKNGVDAIAEADKSRPDWDAFSDPVQIETNGVNIRVGGFLREIDGFDAEFFGISPREAERMDPQQRILLETVWEALEDGGITREALATTACGVFVGASTSDYYAREFTDLSEADLYAGTGIAHSILANRISYFFDLRGPSMTIDTACSSSLTAMHQALSSLHRGEINIAIVAGVNLILSPDYSVAFARAGMLATDNRCKTFDSRANGYVRGEGCGVVILKRVKDADAAGDRIIAVARGSALNQDGRSNGLTAPNAISQEHLIREALSAAGLQPHEISYVEAHGTGTNLGDPIEMSSIQRALQPAREAGNRCAIGSVKTNIGHLEAAAGIAGIIKVALALQNEEIPRSLHFQELNPHIKLDSERFLVATRNLPWASWRERRYAGVSSFGFGGANAHVILGESANPPSRPVRTVSQRPFSFLFSAQSEESLTAYIRSCLERLRDDKTISLADIAFTLANRRTHFEHRLGVVAETREELCKHMEFFLEGNADAPWLKGAIPASGRPRIVFCYSGQGSQWPEMGRRLYESAPVFRDKLNEIDALFKKHLNWSVTSAVTEPTAKLDQTDIAQPAIFALEIALTELLRHTGIKPDAVLGHSIGEVTAACVAGSLSLEDAVILISHRGRLMHSRSGKGVMAAVEMPVAEARALVAGKESKVALGAVNSPTSVVFSGDKAAVESLISAMPDSRFKRLLPVNYAFHSPQMETCARELEKAAASISPRKPQLKIFCSTPVNGEPQFDSTFWAENVRATVEFGPAIQAALAEGYDRFLEVGPHSVLTLYIQKTIEHANAPALAHPTLKRDSDNYRDFLNACNWAHVNGSEINWKHYAPEGRFTNSLPKYQWQHRRYWRRAEAATPITQRANKKAAIHPFIDMEISSPAFEGWLFQSKVSLKGLPYIGDHRITDACVFPGTGYIDFAISAFRRRHATGAKISNLQILRPLVFSDADDVRILQLLLKPEGADAFHFSIQSARSAEGPWHEHAVGKIEQGGSSVPGALNSEQYASFGGRRLEAAEFYTRAAQAGFQYGPEFQGVAELFVKSDEAVARIKAPAAARAQSQNYSFHPALLDATLQPALALVYGNANSASDLYVPAGIEALEWHATPQPGEELYVQTRREAVREGHEFVFDISVSDKDGAQVARIQKLEIRRAGARMLLNQASSDFEYRIEWVELPPLDNIPDVHKLWVIYADESGLARILARALPKATLVFASDNFARVSENEFTVDPLNKNDHERVLSEIFGQNPNPDANFLYLWGVDAKESPELNELESDLRLSCGGLLALYQAAMQRAWGSPPPLFVVTRGAHAVQANARRVSPVQAAIWGEARVAAAETPGLKLRLIDVDNQIALLAASKALIAELGGDTTLEHVILQGGKRWLQRIVKQQGSQSSPIAINPDAAYLVTGGLGGLGLVCAEALSAAGAKYLILVGRKAADSVTTKTLEKISQSGASIVTIQGDISSEDDVCRMLEAAGNRKIAGIVHAAGVIQDGALVRSDWNSFLNVLKPKSLGAWNLHRLAEPTDFTVYFSSISAWSATQGQANYASANAFLDALAVLRNNSGLRTLSINWGPMEGSGMARTLTDSDWNSLGLQPLDVASGYQRMFELLNGEASQAALANANWSRYLERFQGEYLPGPLALYAENRMSPSKAAHDSTKDSNLLQELRELKPGLRLDRVAQFIETHVRSILRLEEERRIERQRGFFQMGLDSIMAVELRNRLQTGIGKQLPPTVAFDYPNVKSISEFITEGVLKLSTSEAIEQTAPEGASMEAEDDRILRELEAMPDDQIEEMLRGTLESLHKH